MYIKESKGISQNYGCKLVVWGLLVLAKVKGEEET